MLIAGCLWVRWNSNMATWFRKNLGDATLASTELERISALFTQYYAHNATPPALFTRHESAGRLHCQLILYCSPASHALATAIDAQACRPPSLQDVSLVCGTVESTNHPA